MLVDRDNRGDDSAYVEAGPEEQTDVEEKEGYDVVDMASLGDSLIVTQDGSDDVELLERARQLKTIFDDRQKARKDLSSAVNEHAATRCDDENKLVCSPALYESEG